jgi:hypothetical protein
MSVSPSPSVTAPTPTEPTSSAKPAAEIVWKIKLNHPTNHINRFCKDVTVYVY